MTKGYFDFNATTPLFDAAREAWLQASAQHWHNASSLYRDAGFTAQKLDAARERLADVLGCEAARIVFTSGATESNNALFAAQKGIVAISAIEHPSVREAARGWLGAERVVEIPVDAQGVVQADALRAIIAQHQPALVSIMAANNESGVLQPWGELSALCREEGISFHTDAAQWFGKLATQDLCQCDYLTGSAHKFGGPKGMGFLVLRDEDETLRFMRGGPQESGRRAGTENYPAIEAMVTALEQCAAVGDAGLRDGFEQRLSAAMPGLRIISEGAPRLWNTSLMVMPRHDNLKWLTRLSRLGFSISTGSACSSGKEGSSVVVRALGATPEELRRVVRVSSGWHTTVADWQSLGDVFVKVGEELDAGGRPA
jgi:cysteine desulfurase